MTKQQAKQFAQERQKKIHFRTEKKGEKTYYVFVDPAGNESRVDMTKYAYSGGRKIIIG